MPIIKKFCYCFSLRIGAFSIAYAGLTMDVLDTVATIYTKSQYCADILLLWIISTIWNIISALVLLTALFRVRSICHDTFSITRYLSILCFRKIRICCQFIWWLLFVAWCSKWPITWWLPPLAEPITFWYPMRSLWLPVSDGPLLITSTSKKKKKIAHSCICGRRDRAELLPIGGLVNHSDYPLTQATDRAQHVAFCGARLGAKIYLENVAQSAPCINRGQLSPADWQPNLSDLRLIIAPPAPAELHAC